MIALIRWILGFAITLIFVFFAAFNRQETELYFSPIHDPITLPLYAVTLGFAGLAFLLGGLTVWLSDGKIRKDRRSLRKTVKSLERELKITETRIATEPQNLLFPPSTTNQ